MGITFGLFRKNWEFFIGGFLLRGITNLAGSLPELRASKEDSFSFEMAFPGENLVPFYQFSFSIKQGFLGHTSFIFKVSLEVSEFWDRPIFNNSGHARFFQFLALFGPLVLFKTEFFPRGHPWGAPPWERFTPGEETFSL